MLKWQILPFKNPQNWFHIKSEWYKNHEIATLWCWKLLLKKSNVLWQIIMRKVEWYFLRITAVHTLLQLLQFPSKVQKVEYNMKRINCRNLRRWFLIEKHTIFLVAPLKCHYKSWLQGWRPKNHIRLESKFNFFSAPQWFDFWVFRTSNRFERLENWWWGGHWIKEKFFFLDDNELGN